MSNFTSTYLSETRHLLERLDAEQAERLALGLARVREAGGRLFILGVGGSAANAAHAVNDFRKIAKIEAYAPTDNVSELTARTNDEGWETVFIEYLKTMWTPEQRAFQREESRRAPFPPEAR